MPAARSRSTNGSSSPAVVFTRSSKTRPRGCFSAAIGPCAAMRALVHHDDVVAGVFDVRQQVRRQDQVDALVVREVADELEHLVAALRIHAVGRLVEKQQIGIVHERLRELDALLHAGRVRLDVAVARLAEADVEQDFVRALHRVDARQPRQLAAVGDERHGVHAGNVRVAFRHVADARANLERRRRRRRGRARASGRASGTTKPSSALIIVLLPAPFGPSRPTAPGGNVAVTSRSAGCARTRRVTRVERDDRAGTVCGGRQGRVIGSGMHSVIRNRRITAFPAGRARRRARA